MFDRALTESAQIILLGAEHATTPMNHQWRHIGGDARTRGGRCAGEEALNAAADSPRVAGPGVALAGGVGLVFVPANWRALVANLAQDIRCLAVGSGHLGAASSEEVMTPMLGDLI